MLNELGGILSEQKARDLRNRIESPRPDQSLPGEYELAFTWAVSRITPIEIDRPVASGKTPDIYAERLFDAAPIHFDVVAIGDAALSGLQDMRRAGNILNDCAGRINADAREHLHYEFKEESGYAAWEKNGRRGAKYFRRRLITRDFEVTPGIEARLRKWLAASPPSTSLTIENEHIHAVVTWRPHKVHPQSFVFSSLPAIAYDLRDNPLFKALNDKKRQLRSAPKGVLKGVLVGDAGSRLLTDIDSKSLQTYSGRQIVDAFLKRADLDVVLVLVPRHQYPHALMRRNDEMRWHLHYFDPRGRLSDADKARLEAIRAALPAPSYYGYQARSLQEQGAFDPQARGQYLGAAWSHNGKRMRVKISARAVQDFLAGRINGDQFRHFTSGSAPNHFDLALQQGMTIKSSSIEAAGTREDDDWIIFEFEKDPAAMKLLVPGDKKEPG